MQNRTNLTAEKRVKEIIANWPQSGFNVEQLLDALLADDNLNPNAQGRNVAIIFRTADVATVDLTLLMRAIYDAIQSPAFKDQETIRRKAVAVLTSTVSFYGINGNIGTSAFYRETSPELRNTYVKTVMTILETCELTADEYVMLLTGPACKDENDRPYITPVMLAGNHDRDNLAAYFDTLTRLVDQEKISQSTYEKIHQQFSKHELTNCMIKAYSHNPHSGYPAPSVDAMLKYLTFMSKVQSKFGYKFSATLNEDSLGYLRSYIPKEAILAELIKKPLEDCSLSELRFRLKNLECARNKNHALGRMLYIRRGWAKTDELSGTLAGVKYAYNQTNKEIFFRELEGLTLSQQLKRCENALISSTDEYSILSKRVHPDQEHDTPKHGATGKRLADKIKAIREELAKNGERPIAPTAPPITLELGNECFSRVGKDLIELHELAKDITLPNFKRAIARFKSVRAIEDANSACELFEGEAAKEIILARNPELTIKFLETLHSTAAVNPDLAVRVGFLLGEIRNKPGEIIQRNLMHNMFSSTFSRYEKNTIHQLRPLLNLLTFLQGTSPISAQGVNTLLGMVSGEGAVFAMSVMTSFTIEGIMEFIHFLSEACNSKENARDIVNMLMTRYNGKNTFELLLETTKNTEVILAFIMLLDKITNEQELPIRLDKLMPSDIYAYGYTIKEKILEHIRSIIDREDCTIYDLEFVSRVCHVALDESQPLGKIIHIQRDATKTSLEKGSLREFANLLHKTEERIKVSKEEFRAQSIVAQKELILDDEFTKQPLTEEHIAVTPPVNPGSLKRESDSLFNHPYLQLCVAESRPEQEVEADVILDGQPHIESSVVEIKTEAKPESPRSTLDIVFGMNLNTVTREVLQPQMPQEATSLVTGNLIDFDSPTQMQIRDQYASQLSDIDFSAPVIIEEDSLNTTEDSYSPQVSETEEEKERRIAEQLANLPPAPTDGTKRHNDKEKKEKDQPKVLAYAN